MWWGYCFISFLYSWIWFMIMFLLFRWFLRLCMVVIRWLMWFRDMILGVKFWKVMICIKYWIIFFGIFGFLNDWMEWFVMNIVKLEEIVEVMVLKWRKVVSSNRVWLMRDWLRILLLFLRVMFCWMNCVNRFSLFWRVIWFGRLLDVFKVFVRVM